MKWIKKYVVKNFKNFTFFYSVLRYRLLIVFSLAILGGLLDSLGLTMFLPLLQMADGGSMTDLGSLSFFSDFLKIIGVNITIFNVLLILIVVFLMKAVAVYYSGIYRIITQQKLIKEIRMNIVDEFPTYPYKEYVTMDVGRVQNIFVGEVVRLQSTYTSYVLLVQGMIMIAIYILFSFLMDWKFALLVCIGAWMSNLVFSKLNRLTKERSINLSKVNDRYVAGLIQFIHQFKYLKATGTILGYKDKVEESIDKTQYENLQISLLANKVSAFREPFLVLVLTLVIGIEVYFLDAKISSIMVSLLFFYRSLSIVVSVQANYNLTISNQGAIDSISGFYQDLISKREIVGRQNFEYLSNKITLESVGFNYGNTNIIKDVSLVIQKNQMVAFVGESGSGKTTLVNIIINLLRPDKGQVLIDDINLNDYNQFSFQKKIGYISQEPTIFNDTIFNNVSFWAEKTPENMARFNSVAQKSLLKDFIKGLPDKEDTLLGNNGVNLSGGQRQRISIARELYKEVDMLILDEATSALDSETETQIQLNIESLQGKVTMIVIAHRLATIKNADSIFEMQNGEIKASGNFIQLCDKSPSFYRMVQLQEL